ncbi:hypothetical protein KDJ21_007125 [Metabacillus litoralis]|uniref:hypothetical protein n=1 Tax=Metabacillus litoralis TaxID=152268 RepID=UPI001BA2730E|nr:hypothetical protein [Metabacillus litoralis]UHA61422.1 hypothetical protein KDJ21_007125 [Metabacillus litoralis]
MSKKKVAKFGLTAAAAVTTVVAANPAGAAAASSVEQAVVQASTNAKALTQFYGNTDLTVSAEFTAAFNSAKKSIANAKAQVAAFSGKEKAYYEATLAQATELQTYAARYIDAVNILSGELADATEALQADVEAGEITAEVVENYNTLSAAIKKAERTIGKVRGEAVREAFQEGFLLDAKLARESVIYEVSQFNLLTQINADIAAGNTANVEADLAKLDRLKERAVEIKEAGKALYPDRTDVYPALPAIETQLRTTETATVVAYEETLAPAVKSVSAINATQVVVTFTQAVDSTDADLVGNYAINGVNPSGVDVAEDKKSATLTFGSASNVEVKNGAVVVEPIKTDADDLVLTTRYAGLLTYEDKVKADVASITSKTNEANASSVEIKFTEPVASGAVIKIDGKVAGATTAGSKTVINSGITLDSTKEHTLEVVNLTDGGGNVNSLVTKSFSVVKDTTAPSVSKVEASGDNHILVTFDKEVTLASVQSKVSVKDEVLGAVSTGTITVVTDGATTSDTQFLIPVNTSLYGTTDTRTLNVVLDKEILDTLGNKSVAVTKQVTLSKDKVAPVLTSVAPKINSDGETTAIAVNFSEGVAQLSGGFDETKIRVVAPDGTDVTSGFFKSTQPAVAAGAKKATVELTTATKLKGVYTFYVAAEAVTDQAQTPNKSVAYTGTIDFGSGDNAEFEILPSAITSTNNKSNNIAINFGTPVKGGSVAGSATDVNNYTLGGKALPAGTVITLNTAKTVATIDLPDTESISATDTAIFTVAGVQNVDGVTITPVTKALAVVDNTKAVLESARVLDNKTIELTFNEDVAALSADSVGTEFKIYQGTTAVTLADAELKANSVSGFANKVRITVDQGTDSTGTPASTFATATNLTAAGTNTAGGNMSVTGTFNGAANETLTVEKTATGYSVDGGTSDVTLSGTTFTYKGLTIETSAVTSPATGDTWTLSLTAAVAPTSATTLDLTKDLFVETLVPATGVDVLDLASNTQTGDLKISVSK